MTEEKLKTVCDCGHFKHNHNNSEKCAMRNCKCDSYSQSKQPKAISELPTTFNRETANG